MANQWMLKPMNAYLVYQQHDADQETCKHCKSYANYHYLSGLRHQLKRHSWGLNMPNTSERK